jgi:hypothetical protein
MNNFAINLNICDECCTKCGTNTLNKVVSVTSSRQTIELQGNYILNIIEAGPNFARVLIQNGINVIIRSVFTTFPLVISLPNNCKFRHVITIFIEIPGV